MLFSRLLTSTALVSLCAASPSTRRHHGSSVARDGAGDPKKESEAQGGYFREATFSPNYDDRFAKKRLDREEERQALRKLVAAYMKACHDLRVDTWLMHSSLLGWWYNKQMLPWDSAVNVQVFEPDMAFLARNYNMSVSHMRRGREYLLDVDPDYVEQTIKQSAVDARWIDMESGLFINIMAVWYSPSHSRDESMMSCRNGYRINDTQIIPLRDTSFEGVEVKIPYRYRDLLRHEFGEQALLQPGNDQYRFDDEKMKWELK